MKKFILLIRGEDKWSELSPAEQQAAIEKYTAWAGRLRSEGRLVDADGLDPDGRVLKGGGVVIDGPFAEIKEVVGGYYVYHAADWDEAVTIAQDCPTLEYGGQMELRKVMDYS